jgi:hypothetical protein
MKMMKIALIGTAALAAVSVSARADELSDLKAQIEALNTRVASVEAAPSVPAGYQLLSINKGPAMVIPGLEKDKAFGDTSTIISVLPTADAPASTTLEITGYARAALVYSDVSGPNNDDFSIPARGQLKISGKTDTAVGEVGATLQIRGNFNSYGDAGSSQDSYALVLTDADNDPATPDVITSLAKTGSTNALLMNEAWGYWAMTPELTLGGGYTGSLSGIGYGYDGQCNCYYTDNARAGYGHGDTTQMRLGYASGPLSFAVALEDNIAVRSSNDNLGVAFEGKYSGDMVSGEISGGMWDSADSDWRIGAGLGFNLGDVAKVGVSGAVGALGGSNIKFEKANILLSANLSDAIHGEVGFNWLNEHGVGASDEVSVLAGIYYDPVDKLTIGLEGEWINPEGTSNTSTQVDLVTVYRF